MGAILLNGVDVGEDCIVAAGTLLPEDTRIPPRSLVMGSPGKVRRELTDRGRRRPSATTRSGTSAIGSTTWAGRRRAPALMASQQTRPARGMRDFLPTMSAGASYVIGVIARRLPSATASSRSRRRRSRTSRR